MTTVAQHKELVRRVFAEAFSQGRLGVIDEVVALGGVDHQHPGEPSFAEHLKQVVVALRTAFPDLRFEVVELIGEGEWVATYNVMTGTHLGPIREPIIGAGGREIPPTGRAIRVPHMHMMRFQDGHNTELWHLMDTMAMLGQLGVLPGRTPATAAAA